ncbi:MAG: hypothetical protein ACM3JD_00190, partial [Rudaea sp.]
AAYLRELRSRACFWRWEYVRFPKPHGGTHDILYLGRTAARKHAMAVLGIKADAATDRPDGSTSRHGVLVSEMPTPNALRVPKLLSTIVPLGRPLDEIVGSYHSALRAFIHTRHEGYRIRPVLDEAEIDRIDRDMLKPFAARHGDFAVQMDSGDVREMALADWGRLDMVYAGEEAVGCQLSYRFVRAGKRYWSLYRCGFPETLFADSKRLREANSMNNYLALKWAAENGYDYLDLGTSVARPDVGVLRWKRERKGILDTLGNHDYLYVRLPKAGTARFLWNTPLFSVRRGRLALHLGIPDGPTDADIAVRYREMGFSGLSRVYLHCERAVGESVLKKFHALYSGQETPPAVQTIPVGG